MEENKTKRYYVDFYDMIDGWGIFGFFDYRLFDDLPEAIKLCDELNSKLPEGNKKCGEHYGVMDSTVQREIYCGQNKKYKEGVGKMMDSLVDALVGDIKENKDDKKIDWSALDEHWAEQHKKDYGYLFGRK